MTERGKYIVIEGTDGTGKSTQAERIAERLNEKGIQAIQFHEPAGVEIANELRTIIKNGTLARSAFTNLLLFSAARRENWLQQGKPALENGTWIVSARDYLSTIAYQGYGEGLDINLIEDITKQSTDEHYMNPDYRFLLDMQNETARTARIANRGGLEHPDTFESREDTFQMRVMQGYRSISKSKNIPIIEADQPIDTITNQIWEAIQ